MTARTAGSPGTTLPPAAPRWVTMFTPIAKRLLKAGMPLGFNGLITIPGRKTGLPRTTPIAIIDVAGRRWVWAPWGGSGGWRGIIPGSARSSVEDRKSVV